MCGNAAFDTRQCPSQVTFAQPLHQISASVLQPCRDHPALFLYLNTLFFCREENAIIYRNAANSTEGKVLPGDPKTD